LRGSGGQLLMNVGIDLLPSEQDFPLDGLGKMPSFIAECPVDCKTFQ